MSKGEELFAKEALNLKGLKKLDKDELISTIEINLQDLVDYYYENLHRKEEREYRNKFTDLILSKKCFLKPLAKIIKTSDEEVPEGLAFMLYDTMATTARFVSNKTFEIKKSNISDEDKKSAIDALKSELEESKIAIGDVLITLTKKTVKKLKKLGFKEVYAVAIAPALFSPQYVSAKNMFRFTRTVTNALYSAYNSSLAKNEDDETVTTAGADLANVKTIAAVMHIITKDMNLGDYAEFVKQILLEKRDKHFDGIGSAMPVYSAITAWALATLEDKHVFNKSTRRNIIESFGKQRAIDEKHGHDAKRRIVFSELDPDMYPNIVKAFNKVVNKDDKD
jgi:hypothetical protein